ncbi:RNA-binding transcriptional accessory protein [Candidatus Bipolaricaulota bacterium]|nr:RNA-binding transcriptional accessory protein [Candidatus Bipolaricaulota bacterium]
MIGEAQVRATAALLSDGATIPFIARYRKEQTGSLDEVMIASIRDRLAQLAELDKRREAVLSSLAERDLLTDELRAALESASTLTEIEDIYLPYRPKRRTRATIAREKGLEGLAKLIFSQDQTISPQDEARAFINAEKGIETIEDALTGARDIIAEWVNQDAVIRQELRRLILKKGVIHSVVIKGKEEEGAKYRDYFDAHEPISKAPGHRILALLRGEREGMLKITIRPPKDEALARLHRRTVKPHRSTTDEITAAVDDAYKRLLAPSLETEVRHVVKKRADGEAIRVFADNLRQLLMAPPLGRKSVLAIDPGFRTGCKLVCLDRQGKLLHNTVIYPTQSKARVEEAEKAIRDLVGRFSIEAIAIGNGTAGRETEAFVRGLDLDKSIPIVMVNESGASIYSASQVARDEFPNHDVTVRGAVSIGRRLMDPLAELVKIDPKSIGVGQYQHDADQARLKQALTDVVESCVNSVGVEVNTASAPLLAMVSGITSTLAKNIVAYRNENGPFRSRRDLIKVPRLGPKAFEQAAGFLRIAEAKNPLDASAVHPESYGVVSRMAADLDCTVKDLMQSEQLRQRADLYRYVTDTIGSPTLRDIMSELAKPGRDPRERFEPFTFAENVHSMDDLIPGMKLPGIVTNVVKFGAFVDIGVHQDGLVHISQLADRFISDPSEVVKVQQRVTVTVLDVDKARGRISLSMKRDPIGKTGNRDWIIEP